MQNLVIFGDTQFAERIYKYIKIEQAFNVLAFTQEADFINRVSIDGLPVVPYEELRGKYSDFSMLIAIGYERMNELRRQIYTMCKNDGYQIATLISRTAVVYADSIGEGTIILPSVHIGPDCQIGKCNFFESASVLSHDNILGDFNFVSTNVVLGGFAKVGNNCFLGLHSTIKNDIVIDDFSFIGSSANILISTCCTGGVFVGNPARCLKHRNSKEIKI